MSSKTEQKLIINAILDDLKASRHLLYLSSGSLESSMMLLLYCWKRFLSYKCSKVVTIEECDFDEILPEYSSLKLELLELQGQLSEEGKLHVGYRTINRYYNVLRKLLLSEYKKVSNRPKWLDPLLGAVKLCLVIAGVCVGYLGYQKLMPEKPWLVTYYQGIDLSGVKLSEVYEDQVSLSKLQFMPRGSDFSVRYQSCLKLPKDFYLKNNEKNFSDELQLKITIASDDGGRVFVDDTAIIDDWSAHQYHDVSAFYAFKLGKTYKITVEYFDIGGVAALQFMGSRPIFTNEFLTAPNEDGEC